MVFLRPHLSDTMPNGNCKQAWVKPYAPIAQPIHIDCCEPANSAAYKDNTGKTKNKPNIRSAYTPDKMPLMRHSSLLN